MSENRRPHIFIREQLPPPTDRTYPNGGGGGTYPRTSYQQHANKIYREASELKAIFAKKDSVTSPADEAKEKVYFRVELASDQNVSTTDGDKLQEKTFTTIVGSPEKNVAHLSTTKQSFESFLTLLNRYSSTDESVGKSNFATIESIQRIPLSEKLSHRLLSNMRSQNFDGDVLVALFNNLTNEEKTTYSRAIEELVNSRNGSVVGKYDSETGLYLRLKADKKTICKVAHQFLAVQSVEPNEEIEFSSSLLGDTVSEEVIIHPNQSQARACIFDSGVIAGSRFLDANMIAREEPLGPAYDPDHGTFVASRIVYGDSIREQIASRNLRPDVKVLSICVRPHDGIGNRVKVSTEKLMSVVRTTVERWHAQIKVYNLSINLMSEDPAVVSCIKDDVVNPLAAEIDNLSKKFDVLFVISTGNFPAKNAPLPTAPYPQYFDEEVCRICPPGEANLALTVGSVAMIEGDTSITKMQHPSPFTRRGPGFFKYRKPDLVAHGGNYVNNWTKTDQLSVPGFGSDTTRVAYNVGTSFSAPLVTRLAAHLFARLENPSAPLVRAMLIHFAKLPASHGISAERVIDLYGNGLPNPDNIISSNKWEQSFVFHGAVSDRKILRIPFYVPNALTNRKGRNVVGVRVTTAFNAETDRTLKSGYCKSHLRTNLFKVNADGEESKVNRNQDLSTINDMYSTVLRRENLFSSGIQGGDWVLTVEHVSRWKLKEDAVKFGAVITVFDPRNDGATDIFNMINQEVPNRYNSTIHIDTNLRV